MSAGVAFKISCSLNVAMKRTLSSHFYDLYTVLCAVCLRSVGQVRNVCEGRNATGTNIGFVVHFPVAFAGGLCASARQFVSSQMRYNVSSVYLVNVACPNLI